MSLLELPNEILNIICEYLDSFSRIQVSKTCTKFDGFFKNNSVTRGSTFLFRDYKIALKDFQKYITENKHHISYLNISHCRWSKSVLFNTIKRLTNLTSLNVIGTELDLNNLSDILANKDTISCVSASYKRNTYLNIKQVKFLHLMIDFQVNFDYMAIKMTEIERLKLTAVSVDGNFLKQIQPSILRFKELTIKILEPLLVSSINALFDNPSNKYYIAIETITGIFLSTEILNEFISIDNLIECNTLDNLSCNYVISLYFCSNESIERVDRFKKRIKNIIKTRSNTNIALFGNKHCPKGHFDAVQHLSLIENVKRLSIQPCSLVTKAHKNDSKDYFKRRRISRIQMNSSETSTIERLSSAHVNIEMLQINGKFRYFHNCDNISSEWVLCSTYLESITHLQNLKYLTLCLVPLLTINSLKIIFQRCILLEKISLVGSSKDLGVLQYIPKILNLCTNIRTFNMNGPVTDVYTYLEAFNSCSLKSIGLIFADSNYKVEETSLMNIITSLALSCPQLTNLTIFNIHKLPDTRPKNLSGVEKRLNELSSRIMLNLKAPDYLYNNNINDIGEFL